MINSYVVLGMVVEMSEEFNVESNPVKVKRFSSPKALRVISFVAPAIVGGAVVASIMNFGVFGGGSRLPQAILITPSEKATPSPNAATTTSTVPYVTSTSTTAAVVVASSTTSTVPVTAAPLEIGATTVERVDESPSWL